MKVGELMPKSNLGNVYNRQGLTTCGPSANAVAAGMPLRRRNPFSIPDDTSDDELGILDEQGLHCWLPSQLTLMSCKNRMN